MSDQQREELQGFAEAWRDDAAKCRENVSTYGGVGGVELRAVADCYDECADEIEAFLKRQADTPTPDGPPAAAPERKAGGRLPVGDRFIVGGGDSCDVWEATGADPVCLARDLKTEDADLLAHGHARLREMEAALRDAIGVIEGLAGQQAMDDDFYVKPLASFRAALGAGPGGGT